VQDAEAISACSTLPLAPMQKKASVRALEDVKMERSRHPRRNFSTSSKATHGIRR